MSLFIILARIVAIAASGVLLLTIANGTIEATNATGPAAEAIYALAVGVFVTAGIMGLAWSAKRYALAVFLFACLLCGEAYNFLKTAEREVTSREAAQTIVFQASQDRETLGRAVLKAEAALEAAQTAVTVKSAERGCVKNCAALLSNAVETARADLDRARSRLDAVEIPPSATPLADRSGMAAWVLDLIAAAFKSLAMNGLAAGLAAFGAHGITAPVSRNVLTVADQVPANVAPLPKIAVSDEPSPESVFAATKAAALATDGGVTDLQLATVAALFRGDLEPTDPNGNGGGKVIRPRRWQREEVRADLTARLAKGEGFESQRAMAAKYGVPQSTLSNWFDHWSAEGREISRHQVGRRKMVG